MNNVETLNQEAQIRDQIVEIVINFLNRNVNSNANANMFIDINQAISLVKVEAMITNLENYYTRLKVKETGSQNNENLFEKVHSLLDENNRIQFENKNFKQKIAELEDKLNQNNKENLCLVKENNFIKERRNLVNENEENSNFKFSRNVKSPFSYNDKSIYFSSHNEDMNYSNKYTKFDTIIDKEKSLHEHMKSFDSFERENRGKKAYISINGNLNKNIFATKEGVIISPLKNIKSKLKEIEKNIVSMKGKVIN